MGVPDPEGTILEAGACISERCPTCGKTEHITVERVIAGASTIDLCHCRACGASWAPGDLQDNAIVQS